MVIRATFWALMLIIVLLGVTGGDYPDGTIVTNARKTAWLVAPYLLYRYWVPVRRKEDALQLRTLARTNAAMFVYIALVCLLDTKL